MVNGRLCISTRQSAVAAKHRDMLNVTSPWNYEDIPSGMSINRGPFFRAGHQTQSSLREGSFY
jgi:hypothetical protein